MLDQCQKSINQIFNTYKNLPIGYFGNLLIALIALEFFSLILSVFLIYGALWIGSTYQFDFTYYRTDDIATIVGDLRFYFPLINLFVLGLFRPYLSNMIKGDENNKITLSKYITEISSKKWNLFIGFLILIFLIINSLYYFDYFSYGTNYFSQEESSVQFKRWLYFILQLLSLIITVFFTILISTHHQFSIRKIKKDWTFIISTTAVLLGLLALTTLFSERIEFYVGQLLVIPFKSINISMTTIYLLQFALFFFIIPAKIALLTNDDAKSINEDLGIEDDIV